MIQGFTTSLCYRYAKKIKKESFERGLVNFRGADVGATMKASNLANKSRQPEGHKQKNLIRHRRTDTLKMRKYLHFTSIIQKPKEVETVAAAAVGTGKGVLWSGAQWG